MKANICHVRENKKPWIGAKALVCLESGNFWIVSKQGVLASSDKHGLEPSIYSSLEDAYRVFRDVGGHIWVYAGDSLELQF